MTGDTTGPRPGLRRTPIQRKTPLVTHAELHRVTPLAPVSRKRRRENAAYRTLRDDFIARYPICQFPLGCQQRTTEVHHKRGRFGARLLDRTYWAASCREHNDFAETHTGEALAIGWLVRIEGSESA